MIATDIAELFLEATKDSRFGDIDFLVEKCEAAGIFSDEELDHAAESYKKDRVRRLMKSIKDDNGWPLFASVVVTEASGEEKRVYKQELMFDIDDYIQVSSYHKDRSHYHMKMANGYTQRGNTRFCEQYPLPFKNI